MSQPLRISLEIQQAIGGILGVVGVTKENVSEVRQVFRDIADDEDLWTNLPRFVDATQTGVKQLIQTYFGSRGGATDGNA